MVNQVVQGVEYAVLDEGGQCVNRVIWDGLTPWQPPEGLTAVADPDGRHAIQQAAAPENPESSPTY
jgi:hypothetical protein